MSREIESAEELSRKRSEYNTFAHHLRKMKMYCANCGSAEEVELHHIVPLGMGGENCWNNLVPLCKKCHNAAAGQNYHKREGVHHGRPKKEAPEGYETALGLYFAEIIGRRELINRLGLKNHRITEYWWYRDYCEKNEITGKWNNHVDHLAAKRRGKR